MIDFFFIEYCLKVVSDVFKGYSIINREDF